MKVCVAVGDVLAAAADVLISTANPWLAMSGGVNAAIRERCPEIQDELKTHLRRNNVKALPAASVAVTSAGNLPFQHIIHAIAIDPFYDSSVELVQQTLSTAFESAVDLNARTVSMPTLATGYGPMTSEEFARALNSATVAPFSLDGVTIVVRSQKNAATLSRVLTTM